MKIFISIFSFLLIASMFVSAQNVPLGMKYQAVARDLSGNILADKSISLQINLISVEDEKQIVYSEVHHVTTNKLGLFTLGIGSGITEQQSFDEVPWSTNEIWMEIKIKEKEGGEFTTISNSQMLSVPYAFHAATAAEVSGLTHRGEGSSPGVPSQNWSLFGNSKSDPEEDKLGTTDVADLVIVTNNKERMRIFSDGDISIQKSLKIGENLEVEQNVSLNTTSGMTTNYGPFTVENMSPTSLTGSLTVYNQQPTLLSGTLTVDLATDLNASLNVDGITNLNSALNVNNTSPTLLTGTLEVDNNATFHQKVLLDNPALSSTSTTTGALVVAGGLGLGENLNVGGSAAFGGPVNFMSPVTISADEESTSSTTGALRVVGGVGIGKRLNVIGATSLSNTLGVTGATTLGSTLGVTGATSLSNTLTVTGASQLNNTLGVTGVTTISNGTASSSKTNGALVVGGGVGIGGSLNIGGNFSLKNNAGSGHVASFENEGNGNGISIKVGAATPHNNNNFITFYNSNNGIVGRIEGENGSSDLANNREYQDDLAFKQTAIALSVTGEVIAIAEEVQAAIYLVAASTSTTACVGLGACVTAPIPSLIVGEIANLIITTASLVLQTADLVTVIADLVVFENTHEALFGITFASGAEDYAEYLPKLNMEEQFLPGDLVGIKNGRISKNTRDADRIMVISHKPAVLGGLPQDGNTEGYEMVAFMGQIYTRVIGGVKPGDYILPSGYHNGFGMAKHPSQMKPSDYSKILGVAWTGSDELTVGLVNVAVGLNANDVADLVTVQSEQILAQSAKINGLQNQINLTNALLADLVPGFKEAANIADVDVHVEAVVQEKQVHGDIELTQSHKEDIIYHKITREHFDAAMVMAENAYKESGLDLNSHPFWKRVYNEPEYKDELFVDLENKLEKAFHSHELNNDKFLENGDVKE